MLSLKTVSRSFGATRAVDTVSLDVAEGELVCLLGPSGCGKSTLLRIIAGLTQADEGKITIDGRDATAVAANRRPTAMVFQSHALWPHMSVARNVGFGLRVRRVPVAEQQRRIAAVLDLVGLAGFETRYPGAMSGGQAQRVALARCLVVEPRILLMDEPFSALDAHLRQRLREDLKALQRRLRLTTIFVTHDQDEAMELADRIAVMREGRIEQLDAPSGLYLQPRTLHVGRFIGEMTESVITLADGLAFWRGAPIRLDAPDGTYDALCRPEDIQRAAFGAWVTIDRVVDLGPNLRVHATDEAGVPLTLSAARAKAPAAGERIMVAPQRLLLFRKGILAQEAVPIMVPTHSKHPPLARSEAIHVDHHS